MPHACLQKAARREAWNDQPAHEADGSRGGDGRMPQRRQPICPEGDDEDEAHVVQRPDRPRENGRADVRAGQTGRTGSARPIPSPASCKHGEKRGHDHRHDGEFRGGEPLRRGERGQGYHSQPDPGGPRFEVGANFRAIKRYNNSDSYAIGVGHLADRITGGGPIRAAFPPDKYGLTKAERQRLQARLTARGFDTQGTDGVIGPNSRKAISAYQASAGLPVTGDPSKALLAALG